MTDQRIQQVMAALKNADAAGDEQAARQLAQLAVRLRDAATATGVVSAPKPARNVNPLVPQVYQAFRSAGFSDEGARVLTAEVGRENDFRPEVVFGSHSDPANRRTNIGMFSWQKDRADQLQDFLTQRGLMTNGRIEQNQESLNAMAKFARREMESGRHGPRGLADYLSSNNVSYRDAATRVGRDFIRWRYTDPNFAHHHDRRDNWYNTVNEAVPKSTAANTTHRRTPPSPESTQGARG